MSSLRDHVRLLAGKVCVITGAGSGVGRASALRFAVEGAHVVLADVRERWLHRTVALVEETGYTARRIRKLLHLYPTPGFVEESMHIFAAEGLRAGQAHPEEDEKIEPRILTLREAEKWIRNGAICDGKSVAAILYHSKFRRSQK